MTDIAFHVNNIDEARGRRPLMAGDVLRTDSRRLNPYFTSKWDLHTSIPVFGKPTPVLRAFEQYGNMHSKYVRQVSSEAVVNLAATAREVIRSYVELVRELEFENIRRDEFPDLPSRMRCVWGTATLEEAQQWVSALTPGKHVQIVRLQVGLAKRHWAFGGHLYSAYEHGGIEAADMVEVQDAARRYWRGEPHVRGQAELLLEGEFKVLEVASSTHASGGTDH